MIFVIDGTEAAGVIAGLLFTAEFIALYESLRWTTASRATVFIYAAPFFVALGAVFLLRDERLRPTQWAGLALAFVGVGLAMLGRMPSGYLLGDALALLAAALWGATTLLIKATPLRRADPVKRPTPSASRRRAIFRRRPSPRSCGKGSPSSASAIRCGSGCSSGTPRRSSPLSPSSRRSSACSPAGSRSATR